MKKNKKNIIISIIFYLFLLSLFIYDIVKINIIYLIPLFFEILIGVYNYIYKKKINKLLILEKIIIIIILILGISYKDIELLMKISLTISTLIQFFYVFILSKKKIKK